MMPEKILDHAAIEKTNEKIKTQNYNYSQNEYGKYFFHTLIRFFDKPGLFKKNFHHEDTKNTEEKNK